MVLIYHRRCLNCASCALFGIKNAPDKVILAGISDSDSIIRGKTVVNPEIHSLY